MTLINLTACVLLSNVAVGAYKDYKKQKDAGLDPCFKAASLGLPADELDFWK
ncbi:MAG: hypothetical protein Q4F92_02030 [Acidaminococcus sp.]|uniref:hypothetical protein n=1 Tax=Acidaminococcus sp. TaxID=1872103 RepID=UPI0026E05446|nr:hypothetical protein [Acidaminococcus sp.]MDO5597107.1 hypothetical protein [Acidaminococcus sp.]